MTAAHLDHEALADFAEGILDAAAATSAEQHLAHCDDCRRRAAEVAEVSRVLARAPTPPMPAHLVERLDAALAAEAASHVPVHRRPRRFQLVAAAAAAVVLVGGGAAAVRTIMDDGDSGNVQGTQPPIIDRTHSNAPPGPAIARTVPFTVLRTGTNYTAARLDAQVSDTLSQASSGGRRTMSAADGALAGCVTRVGGGKIPLLVDVATYEGRAATVVALPGVDTRHTDVWVVGANCSSSNPDLIAHRQITH